MIYITAPGVKPQTPQDALIECPFEELSGWFGDAFDMDVEFVKRDCPVHGKVIDVMFGNDDFETYSLAMTYPEDDQGYWKQEFLKSFVPWLILTGMTGRPITEDFMDKPLREVLVRDLYLTYMEGLWREGRFMSNIGYEWIETKPGEWQVKRINTEESKDETSRN